MTLRKVGAGCLIAVGAVIALLLVVGIIADATGNGTKSGQPATRHVATPHATPRRTVTLLAISGNGDHTSQSFTAGSTWRLIWSYDCHSFGNRGNFIVDIHKAADASVDPDVQGLDQLGMHDAGVEYYHAGGRLYLTISSECAWHVTARG